jgi:hypothetical protein
LLGPNPALAELPHDGNHALGKPAALRRINAENGRECIMESLQ